MKMFYPKLKLIGSYVFNFIFKIQKVDDTENEKSERERERICRVVSEIERIEERRGISQLLCVYVAFFLLYIYSGICFKNDWMWMAIKERERKKEEEKCTNA